jgi:hypothetical protein
LCRLAGIETYQRLACCRSLTGEALVAHNDLAKANHVLLVLRQARLSRREAAAFMIEELVHSETEDSGASPEMEGAYQTTWAAIDELAVSLNTPDGFTGRQAWHKALDAVENWKSRIESGS